MPSTVNPDAVLVDTNILLRIAQFETQHDKTLLAAIRRYRSLGTTLCVTFQNIAEFWNVATRQELHRGFGRSIDEVAIEVDEISRRFTILHESQRTVAHWRTLVQDYAVTGVLVHDACLAAVMLEYEVQQILTLNPKDFARFPFVQTIDPREAN